MRGMIGVSGVSGVRGVRKVYGSEEMTYTLRTRMSYLLICQHSCLLRPQPQMRRQDAGLPLVGGTEEVVGGVGVGVGATDVGAEVDEGEYDTGEGSARFELF